MNVTRLIAVLIAQRDRLHTVSRRAEAVSTWTAALLGPRHTARLFLRYWRLRDVAARRVRSLGRPAALAFGSHIVVLTAGFVLLLPVLTGGQRPTTPAWAGTSGAVNFDSRTGAMARNALALTVANRPAPDAATPPAPAVTSTTRSAMAPAAPPPAAPPPAAPAALPPASAGSGVAAIESVFAGSPGLSWALRVAKCESTYNPLAVNRSSGASGLFQFMPSTWNAHFAGWNIWDPVAQAKAALVFYNNGWTSAWTCK